MADELPDRSTVLALSRRDLGGIRSHVGYRAISGKVALVATPIVRRSGADAAAKGD
jgi:hypothetical protein